MPAELPSVSPAKLLLVLYGLAVLAGIIVAWTVAAVRWGLGLRLLPAARAGTVPWGGLAVAAIVPIWFAAQFLGFLLYKPLRGLAGFAQGPNGHLTDFDKIALVGLINAALLVMIPAFLRRFSGATWSDLGLPGRPVPRNALLGIGLCFLLLPCVYGLMAALTQFIPARQHPAALALVADTSPTTVVLMFVSAILLAPAAEELCFRVVLLGWLTRLVEPPRKSPPPADPVLETLPPDGDEARLGPVPEPPPIPDDSLNPFEPPRADFSRIDDPETPPRDRPLTVRIMPNVITSLLFASLHLQQWPAPVALFVLSLGLGLLYQRTKSLVAPFAMHACFNGLSMMGVLLASLAGMMPPAPTPVPALVFRRYSSTDQSALLELFPLASGSRGIRILDPGAKSAPDRSARWSSGSNNRPERSAGFPPGVVKVRSARGRSQGDSVVAIGEAAGPVRASRRFAGGVGRGAGSSRVGGRSG